MDIQVADAKIRDTFRNYKSGNFENNIQNHKFAAWGLTTAEYGGGFYIVGNKRTCELWKTGGYDSRKSEGYLMCSVPNNAEGYAELCHVLEQYISACTW